MAEVPEREEASQFGVTVTDMGKHSDGASQQPPLGIPSDGGLPSEV